MSSAPAPQTAVVTGDVDCHFHLFDAGVSAGRSRYVPSYTAAFSSWREAALQAGVRQGVVVQASFMGTNNQLLLKELEQNPDCLRGVAVIDPTTPLPRLQAMKALGVRAVRLNLVGTDHRLDGWHEHPQVWEHLQLLGWHLEVHTDAGRLAPTLAQIPADLTVVLDHMGKPQQLSVNDPGIAAVLQRTKHSAVWVKLSGSYRLGGLDAQALAGLWRDELGLHRLVWGSDWPCTNHEQHADLRQLRAHLANWLPSAGDAHQVAAINPRRLYGL